MSHEQPTAADRWLEQEHERRVALLGEHGAEDWEAIVAQKVGETTGRLAPADVLQLMEDAYVQGASPRGGSAMRFVEHVARMVKDGEPAGDGGELDMSGDAAYAALHTLISDARVIAGMPAAHRVWNVAVPVVELVEAAGEGEAKKVLRDRLTAAGFGVYDGEVPGPHAFESEPVDTVEGN